MNNQISTDDLFKASYFLCNSGILKEVKVLNDRQVRFLIEGEKLEEAEQRFYTGKAVVDPLSLKETLSYLRELLKRKLSELETKNRRNHAKRNTKDRISAD